MSAEPWLVPTVNPGGISNETRRALGPLATLVEDPRVQDVFVLGGGAVYVDSGRGTFLAEGLRLGKEQALAAADVSVGVIPGEPCSVARDVLERNGVALVSCEYWRESWVIGGRAGAGLLDVHATARAGVVDGGGK